MTRNTAVGVSRVRALTGLACGVAGLVVLTLSLIPMRENLRLAEIALLYLVPVVAAGAIGGRWAGLPAAVGADLLVNFFFVPPYHTLLADQREHVIVLVVYLLVAAAVSLAIDLAARHRALAARRETEARLLATATASPITDHTLTSLLSEIREAFGMQSVALVESHSTGEHPVAMVGPLGDGRPTLSAQAGPGLRLIAWGPEMFAEDRGTLRRMAAAAARTMEAQRLSQQAARAEDLAEIDRVRTALLAAVGHDLRTPLAGIKAAVTGLRQPGAGLSTEDEAELLATIDDCCDQLTELIDNLLSVSRLEAGAVSVELEPVSLSAVVEQAVRSTHLDHNVISVEVSDDLPLILADPVLLERVIANVLINAAAVSTPGRPAHLTGRSTAREAELAVVDHGPGVPADLRDRMFQPFQRLHDRSTTQGLGLGLAIARGFTETMGGRIAASDTPGGGLTMTITLPTADTPVSVAGAVRGQPPT
jgi:K+-sensing histidine kinase KdpD